MEGQFGAVSQLCMTEFIHDVVQSVMACRTSRYHPVAILIVSPHQPLSSETDFPDRSDLLLASAGALTN